MEIALIIGGNTGIGLAISRKLITLGFRVYAIAEDFTKTPFAHKDFIPVPIQLHDFKDFEKIIEEILSKEDNIYTIVNAPEKISNFEFNSTSPSNLEAYLTQHLLNPILLTRLTIHKIKQFQGFIINIFCETPSDPINQTIESGLSAFYAALFQDCRTHGVSITDMIIQSTSDSINCEMIANTIDHLIRFKSGNTITKLYIHPQDSKTQANLPQITPTIDQFKEIQLPIKDHFPPEQKLIPTQQPRSKHKPQKTLKVSRETIIIPREKKSRPIKNIPQVSPSSTETLSRKSKQTLSKGIQKTTTPSLAASKNSQPIPKVTKETVIIPREKKSKISKPEKSKPYVSSTISPEAAVKAHSQPVVPSPTRIRRGRPSIKKDNQK